MLEDFRRAAPGRPFCVLSDQAVAQAALIPVPHEGAVGSSRDVLVSRICDEVRCLQPLALTCIALPRILDDSPRDGIQLSMKRAQLRTVAIDDNQALLFLGGQEALDSMHQDAVRGRAVTAWSRNGEEPETGHPAEYVERRHVRLPPRRLTAIQD